MRLHAGVPRRAHGRVSRIQKNVRQEVSGDTLASISEQVQKAERDLKFEQDALMIFQRTNNLAIIEEEGRIAGGYLARLKTQLSDLELEARLLAATALAQPTNAATNAQSLDLAVAASFGGPSSSAPAEHQATFKEIELLKLQRERLSKNLRPKHPKIVKLDADIERGEKLAEIYRRQSREQLASSQAAIQLKMENVRNSIREWEGKVVEANSRIAEAERLKMNVQRAQGMYERLALLVQNVGISRNIDHETLAILEPASLPERSYTREIGLAGMAGFGGLGLGLGLIFLIVVRDDRFESVVEVTEKLPVQVVGQVPKSARRNGSPASLLRPTTTATPTPNRSAACAPPCCSWRLTSSGRASCSSPAPSPTRANPPSPPISPARSPKAAPGWSCWMATCAKAFSTNSSACNAHPGLPRPWATRTASTRSFRRSRPQLFLHRQRPPGRQLRRPVSRPGL
jgi:hypothetical protein